MTADEAVDILETLLEDTKKTAPKWVKTRLCGCGECRFHPASERPRCPLEKHPDARWLWMCNPDVGSELKDIHPVD
jgi:hypothetical protein